MRAEYILARKKGAVIVTPIVIISTFAHLSAHKSIVAKDFTVWLLTPSASHFTSLHGTALLPQEIDAVFSYFVIDLP